jgi:hypothetical protein
MGLGGERHTPAALPPGKTRYPLYGWLDGPQGGYRPPPPPPPGFDLRTVWARSESLYRLSYDGTQGTDDNLQIRQVSWSADRKRKLYLIIRSVCDLQIH